MRVATTGANPSTKEESKHRRKTEGRIPGTYRNHLVSGLYAILPVAPCDAFRAIGWCGHVANRAPRLRRYGITIQGPVQTDVDWCMHGSSAYSNFVFKWHISRSLDGWRAQTVAEKRVIVREGWFERVRNRGKGTNHRLASNRVVRVWRSRLHVPIRHFVGWC